MKLFVHQLDNLDNYIQINLLDNPVISRWFDYCINVQEISGSIINMPIDRPKRSLGKTYHDTQYQLLIDTIHQLKQCQLPVDINFPEIPNVFNFDQHWCNEIHNIFVVLIKYLELHVSFHDRYSNPDYIKIEKLASAVNSIIHDLEYDSYQTLNEKFCCDRYPHSRLQTFIQIDKNKDHAWFEITAKEQQLYHSSNHSCNVIFGNNILGKTYFVSFLQDEVASPAVSGITGTWGDIEILLDNNRTHIYNSYQFYRWLDKSVPQPMPTSGWSWRRRIAPMLDFPVGNIDSSCDLKSFSKQITGKKFVYKFVR